LLALLAEARLDHAEEGRFVGHLHRALAIGVGVDPHQGGGDIRARPEDGRGEAGDDSRAAIVLHRDAQQAQVAGRGYQPVGHFVLHHDHQAAGLVRLLEQVAQNGAGDVVRQVGDHTVRLIGADVQAQVDFQDVGVHQGDVGVVAEAVVQQRDQAVVQLDGDHPAGDIGQPVGQRAGARADLQHGFFRAEFRRADDLVQGVGIVQKVLAQAFLGADAVAVQEAFGVGHELCGSGAMLRVRGADRAAGNPPPIG